MNKKTEYRIIQHETFIADLYLQFKQTVTYRTWFGLGPTRSKEVWCYVPDMTNIHTGMHMYVENAPTKLSTWHEDKYISSFYEQESFEILPFVEKWPNIDDYFSMIRERRQINKIRKAKNREFKTKILKT